MLILDRSRALDRMIWTASRDALVVPEPFSTASMMTTAAPRIPVGDARWRDNPPAFDHGPRRLSSTLELRAFMKPAS
jgi:hypothetical protein